jgi:hypothetical protein
MPLNGTRFGLMPTSGGHHHCFCHVKRSCRCAPECMACLEPRRDDCGGPLAEKETSRGRVVEATCAKHHCGCRPHGEQPYIEQSYMCAGRSKVRNV